MDITRILCPVDFSEFSRRALHHAQALAATWGAELHVLHVVPELVTPMLPLGGLLPPIAFEDVTPATLVALDRFVAEDQSPVRAETAVRRGQTVVEILDYAGEMCADLLVTGTHGHTGLGHVLLGSTAERLVHHAACPVLTVPRRGDQAGAADRTRFTHVLVASDFSPASMHALQLGRSIAREHGAALSLLHVLELLTDEEARMQAHYRVGEYVTARRLEALERLKASVPPSVDAWRGVSAVVELGSAGRVILQQADQRGADLIVMGAQGHGGLGLVIFGSTTQVVLRGASVPVLTTRGARADDRLPAVATARERSTLSSLIV